MILEVDPQVIAQRVAMRSDSEGDMGGIGGIGEQVQISASACRKQCLLCLCLQNYASCDAISSEPSCRIVEMVSPINLLGTHKLCVMQTFSQALANARHQLARSLLS